MNITVKEREVIIDGQVYVPKGEMNYAPVSQPKFKVGQWAAWMSDSWKCSPFRIVRIGEDGVVWSYNESTQTEEMECDVDQLVTVTPSEIEAHLREICDEKYVGKGVRCLSDLRDVRPVGERDRNRDFYESNCDKYWIYVETGHLMLVYSKGKWAEILPDKKALPETRDEFIEMVKLYFDQNNDIPFVTPVDVFIDQYDFNE